ncbi:uncharacterized protein LOC114274857 [Camellia sinensis]|uniref:uncharacterized protein LOC114274857 n=1 Tax=Camellia sinensis TaxID=4442 RepID=UPI0010356C03|nr:uncharacterized protein LOC114274857 [Camellia sinensis]
MARLQKRGWETVLNAKYILVALHRKNSDLKEHGLEKYVGNMGDELSINYVFLFNGEILWMVLQNVFLLKYSVGSLADHSVQHMKASIFDSFKRREPNPLLTTIESMEPEVMPTIPLLSRSKERSLSSLVSQPKASNRAAMSRRKKSLPRKFLASRGSTLSIEELMKNREAIPENSSPLVTLTKIAENKKPNFCAGESSKQNVPCECAKAPVEPLEGMTALWKPLNCLVETAGITKPDKSILQESVANSALPIVHEDEENANKITKLKERANKSKVNNDEGRPIPVPSGSEKPKKNHRGRPKRAMATEGTNIAPQAVVNAASTMCYRKVHPIWLSLIPSDAQLGSTSFFEFTNYKYN